uniref:Gamma-tubulin complex component n=1 Tax=Mesocestoides corti TaxID=53468 RepID=A0A5K3FES5_MESCO
MSDTSDREATSSITLGRKVLPCPWNEVPSTTPIHSELENLDESSLAQQLQTEYWWVNKTRVKVGPDVNSRFKEIWLSSSSAQKHESRIDLSEYQVVRECLWVLLGAEKSFLFTCYTDSEILTKNVCLYFRHPACLTHLTYGALDSFLYSIAKYSTCVLQIRAFTEFVLLSPVGTVSLPFTRLAESCSRLKDDFYRVIASIERDARLPQVPPVSLINLANRLKSWFRRLAFMASLLLQVCSPQLCAIKSHNTPVLLLNRLEELSCTFRHCLSDPYMVNLISNVHISTTDAYLSDMMSEPELRNCLSAIPFVKFSSSISPSHPMFWQCGISLSIDNVPNILRPVVNDIVIGVKSLALLKAIASTFGNAELLATFKSRPLSKKSEKIPVEPEPSSSLLSFDDPELCELVKDMQMSSFTKGDTTCASVSKETDDLPHRTLRCLREEMKVILQKASAHLCSCLLKGPLIAVGQLATEKRDDEFTLIYALNHIADVALFRAGDRMYEFCRGLFSSCTDDQFDLDINRLLKSQLGLICGENSWMYERICIVACAEASREFLRGGPCGCDVINSLTLQIEIPWPLNVVLTEQGLDIYNRVFKFLLMVS